VALQLLFLVPLLPLLGFILLALGGRWFRGTSAGVVGTLAVVAAFGVSVAAAASFLARGDGAFRQVLGDWVSLAGLRVSFALRLDPLSLVMMEVVTFVASLIHLYAIQSMAGESGYPRFFAYMNLFVAFMLTLVLADNLVFLVLGWEGVGLCSYLLIGFWYRDRANGLAAQKAFITTRIGDAAMMVALFIFFASFRTFDIQAILAGARGAWTPGGFLATATAVLLLAGACGKSAQLPLQVWLPDAMAGPTPVSALIHAATMVTAGVYLIARLHALFQLAPAVLLLVAVVGSATSFVAAWSALAQRDIKRVLAYSTISQIGYMFLALGVGAWGAAIFHLMTHAFFKALLFLGAGVVIDALHHEHDLFKMGGLRRALPLTFWTFVIGAASLAALPLVTAGFFSKDMILWFAWASPYGSRWLWLVALVTALLTGLYSFRMVFLAFFGEPAHPVARRPGALMRTALVVLAVCSLFGGHVALPEILGGVDPFGTMLAPVLPPLTLLAARAAHRAELALLLVSALVSLAGVWLAWIYYRQRYRWERTRAWQAVGLPLRDFLYHGWGFDWLYTRLLIRPYVFLATLNRRDVLDRTVMSLARAAAGVSRLFSASENGQVRTYAAGVLVGAILLAALLLAL
jgi:NADH-quinone oxidoreductase subunit L